MRGTTDLCVCAAVTGAERKKVSEEPHVKEGVHIKWKPETRNRIVRIKILRVLVSKLHV